MTDSQFSFEVRARTLSTIREMAQSLHQDDTTAFHQIFESIGSTPTEHRPSSEELTGIGLETLDRIYSDKTLRSALGVVRLPDVSVETKTAAQDIQGLAITSRAAHSIDTLQSNHGETELSRAQIFLIYATVAAIAEHTRTTFDAVLEEVTTA